MTVNLTPHAAELLRSVHERHPELSEAEIVEQALAERLVREQSSPASELWSAEAIRDWLDELSALSDRIPPMPREKFGRDMIYQDHD
jgi:hypothetical protein